MKEEDLQQFIDRQVGYYRMYTLEQLRSRIAELQIAAKHAPTAAAQGLCAAILTRTIALLDARIAEEMQHQAYTPCPTHLIPFNPLTYRPQLSNWNAAADFNCEERRILTLDPALPEGDPLTRARWIIFAGAQPTPQQEYGARLLVTLREREARHA